MSLQDPLSSGADVLTTQATEIALVRMQPYCPKCGSALACPSERDNATDPHCTEAIDVKCICGTIVLAQYWRSISAGVP